MIKVAALVVLLATLNVGCMSLNRALHTIGTIAPSDPPPTEAETILVVGVPKGTFSIAVFAGDVVDGKFVNDMGAVLAADSKDGYVVGKVKAGRSYAILGVRSLGEDGETLGASFSACGEAQVAVFSAKASKVTYVGTASVRPTANNYVSVSYSEDLVAARKYVDTAFPALAGRVEAVPRTSMATKRSCR